MRCFLVTGPESAGNRLVAAILARAGCIGEASTASRFNDHLPKGEDPAVVIRSMPHGGEPPDLSSICDQLRARGYEVTVLVTSRHPTALASSQVERGHAKDLGAARGQIEGAYALIFRVLFSRPSWYIVPYESLVLDPDAATAALLELLDLPQVVDGPLLIDGLEADRIRNENRKHFLLEAPCTT